MSSYIVFINCIAGDNNEQLHSIHQFLQVVDGQGP